jgi:hypothetical protein
MTNAHLIDYAVITLADLTALFFAWLAGKKWFRREATKLSGEWQKSGSLYWLGSDLMWTWTFATQGNVQRMNHGLKQAIHHATVLGLDESLLSRLKNLQQSYRDKQELSGQAKVSVIRELDDLISEAGKLAVRNQPGFKSDPE